jgi:hypothetical protein
LGSTLGVIFITDLAVGNSVKVLAAIFGQKSREASEKEGVSPDRKMSMVEKQYTSETFDKMLGSFILYQETTFQFGYATLFSAAFPLAPLLAFANNFVKIRVDAWKLLQCCRRPEPSGCEDIGTWYVILDLISTFSVITNGLLVFFVASAYTNELWWDRFVLFLIFEHILVASKVFAAALMPDVPKSTEIQLARQKFIESKVIENERDDGEDTVGDEAVDVSYEIAEQDADPVFED